MKKSAETFMRQALTLAAKGAGRVSPNPLVGAVVVRGGKVLARGYHRAFGGAHAEIEALRKLDFKARGAELYINLEPCCHQGKTPPCVPAIVRAGIKRVVIANRDPNPLVNGRGIGRLKKAGIEVIEGVMKEEGAELNRAFLKFIVTGRPYVTLKIAASLDGKIAPPGGRAQRISSEASRPFVHRLRAESDAVLVGVGTVLADDPQLTPRLADIPGQAPWRVVLDSRLRTPATARILQGTDRYRTLILCGDALPEEIKNRFRLNEEVGLVPLPAGAAGLDLDSALGHLGCQGVARLLVEGGAKVFSAFLEQGLADELILITAPRLIGSDGLPWYHDSAAPPLKNPDSWCLVRSFRLGEDLVTLFRRKALTP